MAGTWWGIGGQRGPSQAVPATSWQGAATEWARLRHDPDIRALWWRVACLLALGCLGLLALERVALVQRPTIEPYYVYVNPKGEVLGTERIGGKPYQPEEELLRHVAQEWLEWVRAIPLDPQVLEQNWGKAMRMSTPAVAQRLYSYAQAIELTKLAKKAQARELALKVVIESVLMLSERSLRMVWHETLYDGNNAEKDTSTWTGELEFIIKKPATQQEFDQNALGIWVARIVWNKNLT